MTDKLLIWNTALSHVNEGETVADEQEETEPARVCRLHFDSCRREVIAAHDWTFARRITPLSPLSANAPDPFLFWYTRPAQALAIRKVYKANTNARPVDFESMGATDSEGSEALVICTYSAVDWCHSTRDVEDASRYPAMFVTTLAARLAVNLSFISRDPGSKSQEMWGLYQRLLFSARSLSDVESSQIQPASGLLASRSSLLPAYDPEYGA